jgi:Flp pilus assembly protein TadD
LRFSPDDARIHNVLAVALAQLNDFATAVFELQSALRLEPNNPLFRSNLSCVQQRVNNCQPIP